MASNDHSTILQGIARRAMLAGGFEPDFPPRAEAELARLGEPPLSALRDLRDLPWSSIDNDDSLDLDQLEVCVPDGARTRLLVAIADVDALVSKDSALDGHARTNTTSVYTPAKIFPMLPEQLSTDRTSLNEGADRAALIVEMVIEDGGIVAGSELYRAVVRNRGIASSISRGATASGCPLNRMRGRSRDSSHGSAPQSRTSSRICRSA